MITGPDYVISARMGVLQPELVLDIYPRRGYPCCMGATGTDKRQAHKDEIDGRFPLDDEGYVLEAIREVLADRYATDAADKVGLIGWILDRSQELLDEDVDDEVPAADPAQVDELIRGREIRFGED
jgi:hypothetical protein